MPKIPTNEDFDKKLKAVHGEKFKRLEDRIPNQKNIKMWCENCHKEWFPRIGHLLNGFGCPNCRKMKTNELDNKIFEIFNGKYIRISEYDELQGIANQKIKMECKVCGCIRSQRVNHVLEGHGCWACMRKTLIDSQRITKEEFISRSIHINGKDKYDYSFIPTIENQRQKVPLICKNHGVFLQIVSCHLYNKAGCPKCNESKGEKSIRLFLESNNINYTRNKSFKGCKYKKLLHFDFFIPQRNICIEFDGEQHKNGMRVFGKKRFTTVEKNNMVKLYKIRDKIKDDYCKNNNISLLRIWYKDYNKIPEILSKYFDLKS